MFEICPVCGRYSLARDYPPRPCPICEEELQNNPGATPFRPLPTPQAPERHPTT